MSGVVCRVGVGSGHCSFLFPFFIGQVGLTLHNPTHGREKTASSGQRFSARPPLAASLCGLKPRPPPPEPKDVNGPQETRPKGPSMTVDHGHREAQTTDAHLAQQPPNLSRAIAQRLAVERASLKYQAQRRWYDETEAWRNVSQAATEELFLSGDHLTLLLAATGWPATGPDRTRREMLRCLTSWPLRRLLRLDAGVDLSDRHRVMPGDAPAEIDPACSLSARAQLVTEPRPTYAPVSVLIGEGTTKEEAIALLEQVLTEVKEEFEDLLLGVAEVTAASEPPAEEEELPEWDQVLLVAEGSYRSSRWTGSPVLTSQEARALGDWLLEQAARGEAVEKDPDEDGDAFPL